MADDSRLQRLDLATIDKMLGQSEEFVRNLPEGEQDTFMGAIEALSDIYEHLGYLAPAVFDTMQLMVARTSLLERRFTVNSDEVH